MLSRANLPIETVALAVCILDSLDAKFARTWRLSCPLTGAATTTATTSSSSKRHTMPPELLSASYHQRNRQQQLHIDAVRPELIVLAALVIAAKFTEDPQESAYYYCEVWGRGLWSTEQLNATEMCIMTKLEYRILPLYNNEELLTDAMVDMQLAARQRDWHYELRQPTPPETESLGVESAGHGGVSEDSFFVPAHSRSKTTANIQGFSSLSVTVEESTSPSTTPQPHFD